MVETIVTKIDDVGCEGGSGEPSGSCCSSRELLLPRQFPCRPYASRLFPEGQSPRTLAYSVSMNTAARPKILQARKGRLPAKARKITDDTRKRKKEMTSYRCEIYQYKNNKNACLEAKSILCRQMGQEMSEVDGKESVA